MALGAEAKTVRRLVLRQVGSMTAAGAVIGVAIAAGLSRVAETLLFQISARDPFVFAGAAIVLITVAFAAGLIPARRASRVDPMTALRYE
jgi:ABC-type antimicrobial peptide transport system permease subunit